MQKHYCSVCNRILSSAECPLHGEKHTVLVDIEPVRLQADTTVRDQENPPHSAAPPPQGDVHSAHGEARHDQNKWHQNLHSPVPAQIRPSASTPSRPASHSPAGLFSFDPTRSKSASAGDSEILRFRRSERMLHWAIAIPFMVCWVTSAILVFLYNPDPHLPLRDIFAWTHRLSGVCLIVLPIIVLVRGRSEYRMHLYNIKCAWRWSLNDLKWLALMGLAAVSKKIVLPEQGKFNAAEKINFMSLMVSCPIFIVTGIMIWLHSLGWAAWLIHSFAALMASPTMLGHIYMATVNPDTRTGLKGMISGYVDRQWARHHYGLWYKENFEQTAKPGSKPPTLFHPPDHRVHMHCPSCAKNMMVSWTWILEKIFTAKSVVCPSCGATLDAISTITNQQELEWIQARLDKLEIERPQS